MAKQLTSGAIKNVERVLSPFKDEFVWSPDYGLFMADRCGVQPLGGGGVVLHNYAGKWVLGYLALRKALHEPDIEHRRFSGTWACVYPDTVSPQRDMVTS